MFDTLPALMGGPYAGKSYAAPGLTPPCTRDEAKRAHRRKAAGYHPDRLARQDVPDELRSFGERRFKLIAAAYERIESDLGPDAAQRHPQTREP